MMGLESFSIDAATSRRTRRHGHHIDNVLHDFQSESGTDISNEQRYSSGDWFMFGCLRFRSSRYEPPKKAGQ